MATVIDSLLIELGLDTSKFDKAQKKSVDELRKFDDANQKAQKNVQKTSKDTAEGFTKARDALISFGTAIFGISAFSSFVNTMTNGNASLGRNAQLLSMSATELAAWGGVLKTVGGTAEEFQSSLEGMQKSVALVAAGDTGILKTYSLLGALDTVNIQKGTVDLYKLADAIKRTKDEHSEQYAFGLAQQLGISKSMFFVMEKGGDSLHKLQQEEYQLAKQQQINTESAERYQKQMANLGMAFDAIKNKIMNALYPSLKLIADNVAIGIQKFLEWDKSVNGAGTKALILTSAIIVLGGVVVTLGTIFSTTGVLITGSLALITTSLGIVGTALTGVLGTILAIPAAVVLMSAALDKFGGGPNSHKEKDIDPRTGKMWHLQSRKTGKGSEWVLQDNPEGNKPTEKWIGGKTRGSGGHWEKIPQITTPQITLEEKKSNEEKLIDYFQSQKWTKEQSAGIVGNLSFESGGLNTKAENKGHVGIAQWDNSRQKDFEKWAGFNIKDPRADLMKQAQFVQYELTQGTQQSAGNNLKASTTVPEATKVIYSQYEKPGNLDTSESKREDIANKIIGMIKSPNVTNTSNVANASNVANTSVENSSNIVNNSNEINHSNETNISEDNKDIFAKQVIGLFKNTNPPNNPIVASNENTGNANYLNNQNNMIGAQASAPISNATNNSNVNVAINSINIETQATDANGIAQSIKPAIQNNALINYGLMGYA